MSVFVIGDLHLAIAEPQKTMEVFRGWENYREKIEEQWKNEVKDGDTVVLAGDSSWGMELSPALEDFKFINSLPGEKLIMKGNHDYWWTTASKMNRFFLENGLSTLKIFHNNAYPRSGAVLCGTRGWIMEESNAFTENDRVVSLREAGRLRMSLDYSRDEEGERIVFLHYPPIFGQNENSGIIEIMHEYGIKKCFFGHIHGASAAGVFEGVRDGIEYKLISADRISFKPYKVI